MSGGDGRPTATEEALAADNERLREENERLRATLDAMQRSSSWRLTAPLRAGLIGTRRLLRRAGIGGVPPRWTAPLTAENYRRWVTLDERAGRARRRAARAALAAVRDAPRVSLLLPVRDEPEADLDATLASVLAQIHPGWQLCLIDDGASAPHVARALGSMGEDARVVVSRRERGSRAGALRDALALATGDLVAVLAPGDRLAADALAAVALAAGSERDIVYTDEDRIDAAGARSAPVFKPGWSPDLLLAQDYLGRLCAIRRSRAESVGGFREGFESAEEHDLALRAAAGLPPERVAHVATVLLHRRGDPDAAADASRRAVADSLRAGGVAATVVAVPGLSSGHRVIRRRARTSVSVIVPTRDRAELLERCAADVLAEGDVELLVVDNGSREARTLRLLETLGRDRRVRVLAQPGPFNWSALNNAAAREATGEVLVLLNNDIEAIGPGWLAELASEAARPEIGAVGAKLLFGDGRVQHGGVWLGPENWARHFLRLSPGEDPGYRGQLALTRALSAVTGACLALRKSMFEEVGGLDERFRVSFNDIDLCLRIGARGYRVLWTPHVVLRHLESASRGKSDTGAKAALVREEHQLLREIWGERLNRDPFFNPNLDLVGEEVLALTHPPRFT